MTADTLLQIDIADLHDSPFNPRRTFTDISDLAASIKAEGRVLQPLLVRPVIPPLFADQGDAARTGYEIVFGHRRRRGAEEAGLATVACMVRSMSDAEARSAQIAENLQRKDVHPIEEAEGFQAMLDNDGISADELAELVGKSRSYIYGRLKLLQACDEVRTACLAGDIGSEVALLVARLRTPKLQAQALAAIKRDTSSSANLKDGGRRSYRHIRDMLADKFTLGLNTAIFDPADAALLPTAGTCADCPKRTGNAPEFADLASKRRDGEHGMHYSREGGPDICTDPDCFAAKKAAHLVRAAAVLQAKGEIVVAGNKAKQAVDAHGRLKAGYMAVKDANALLKQATKAGTAAPAILTIQDPRTGKTQKAVRVADLSAAGIKAPAAPPRNDPRGAHRDWEAERRQRERVAAIEQAQRRAVQDAVRPCMLAAPGTASELRLIAWVVLKFIDYDVERRALQRYGIDARQRETVAPALDLLGADQLRTLLLDLVIEEAATVENDHEPEAGRDVLHLIARLYGVNAEGISTPASAGAGAEGADHDKTPGQSKPTKAAPAGADAQAMVDAGVTGDVDANHCAETEDAGA